MKHFLLLVVSVVFLVTSACSAVTVKEPIGEEPISIQPIEWEGLWKLYFYDFINEEEEESFLLIEVSDSNKGVLKVQTIGHDSVSLRVYLRESNEWMFGSYMDSEATDKGMVWGRFKKHGDYIVFWTPDYDRFSDLVNEGLLPGHLDAGESDDMFDSKNIILSGLKPEHMDLITSGSKGVMFEWEYPFFMVRLSDGFD